MTNESEQSLDPQTACDSPLARAQPSPREQWLELALQANQTGVWEYYPSGDRFSWSDSCRSLFGIPLENLPENYAQFLQQICPSERDRCARSWERALQERSRCVLEYRWRLPDGRECWLEQQGKFIEEGRGREPRLLGLIKALERPPQPKPPLPEEPVPEPQPNRDWQYRQILEAISDLILVKDPQSQVVWANQAFCDFYGLSRESLRDLIDAPKDTLQSRQNDARVRATRETLVIPNESATRADGQTSRFQTVKSTVRNPQGEIVLTVDVSRPLTQMLEAELQQREESLYRINSVLPGAIFQYEADRNTGTGQFTYVSATVEALFELTAVAMLKRPVPLWDIMHPEDVARIRASIARAIQNNTPWSDEFRIITASGREKWISGKTELLSVKDNLSCHNGIFIEITDLKQAEASLAASEARLRAFIKAFPDLIFRLSATGRFIDCLAHPSVSLVMPIREFIGKPVREVLPDFLAERVLAATQQVLETGQLECFEYQLTLDGQVIDYEARLSAVNAEEVTVIVRDIGDRKALEAEVNAQKELLAAFIAASPVGIAIIDERMRYLHINQTLAAINGKSAAEHIGKPIAEMIPPSVVPQIESVCQRVLTTGESLLGIEATDEGYGIPDNVRTQLVSYFPLRQGSRQSLLVGIVTYDITDRKRAEAALEESEARLRAFVEAIPDLVFRLNRDGFYLDFFAPASVPTIVAPQQIIGNHVRDLLPEFLADLSVSYAQRALTTRQLECFEYQLPTDDDLGHYEARFSAVNDEEVMVIVRDITDRKRAEVELAASEARLRAFIEAIPDLIFRLDREGNYLDCIAPLSEPLLSPPEELIGRNIRNVLPEGLAERALTWIRKALATKELECFEYQLPSGDRWLDYEARIAAINSEEVTIIVRDISARKQAEAAQARLNDIIESTSDLVGTADLQGKVLYINRAWRAMLGLTPEQELVGLSIERFHPRWALEIVREEGIPSALREGIWQGETALLDGEGREVPVSQVILIHRGEDGAPESLSTIVRDITNLKATETVLEEKARLADFRADVDAALTQEDSLAAMLSRCTEAAVRYLEAAFARIWTLNPETRVLELQASSGLYTHLDGPHGRIALGQDKIGRIAARSEAHLTNNILEDSLVDREWAQREGLVAFAGYPIVVDGNAIGVIALFARKALAEATLEALNVASYEIALGIRRKQAEDALRQRTQELERTLSELQNTQAQLIQTEKMSSLGQMVAGIAHEINNPINFIHGNISHAKSYISGLIQLVKLYRKTYCEPTPEIEDKIEEIELDYLMHDLWKLLASMKVGSDRIRKIVLSLRNFARLDEAEMKPVNLHDGIDSTLLVLQHRLRNIQLHREYGNLPPVECYAGQFNQVLLNILSNAIDALEIPVGDEEGESERSARITITTECLSEERVTVAIADNGPGMPETVRQKLFDPFFTTKPVGKGTGLGLSISYQIVVEKHGGKLECLSTPGRGTILRIEIPIHQPRGAG